MVTGFSTISAIGQDWDIIIIGAGPAGAFAANLLTGSGKQILLVDKASWPRTKVCGCCINTAALTLLKSNGLSESIAQLGGIPLQSLELHEGSKRVNVALPGGISLSRSAFDKALVDAAMSKGITFLPSISAQIEAAQLPSNPHPDYRSVVLNSQGQKRLVTGKVIVVADGLSGRSLELLPEFACKAQAQSRFGCGTIIDDAPDFYQAGHIYMACTDNGYAGLVRLEDGRVDVAAAIDHNYSRAQGGAASAVIQILKESHLPVPPALANNQWSGTEPLTRKRSRIASNRIFVIGDACGYAEPFSGEGIAWALTSAAACAPIVKTALHSWTDSLSDRWQRQHRQMMRPRHKRCQAIGQGLRRRYVRRVAMPLLAALPDVAAAIVRQIVKPIE